MNLQPINHLKISHLVAIEAVRNSSENNDLELVGIEPLKLIAQSIKQSVESGGITPENTFSNIFGYNTNFFYILESINENPESVCLYERGIASIYQQDNKVFLKRIRLFLSGDHAGNATPSVDGIPKIIPCGTNTLVYSSIPPTYLEAISPEHCVLCSSISSLPHPVHIDQDSLLGRFEDTIQSISLNDNRLIDKFLSIISSFSKQLKLKTSKLSLKRVEPEVIDMVPTSNVKAKQGSLYYDESDNTLKLYTGEKWRTLAFVKE